MSLLPTFKVLRQGSEARATCLAPDGYLIRLNPTSSGFSASSPFFLNLTTLSPVSKHIPHPPLLSVNTMESHSVLSPNEHGRNVVAGICHPSSDPKFHQDVDELAEAARDTSPAADQ
jgi:hypothetical protein